MINHPPTTSGVTAVPAVRIKGHLLTALTASGRPGLTRRAGGDHAQGQKGAGRHFSTTGAVPRLATEHPGVLFRLAKEPPASGPGIPGVNDDRSTDKVLQRPVVLAEEDEQKTEPEGQEAQRQSDYADDGL